MPEEMTIIKCIEHINFYPPQSGGCVLSSFILDRSWSGTNWNQSLTLLMTIIIANSNIRWNCIRLHWFSIYTSSFIHHISINFGYYLTHVDCYVNYFTVVFN